MQTHILVETSDQQARMNMWLQSLRFPFNVVGIALVVFAAYCETQMAWGML